MPVQAHRAESPDASRLVAREHVMLSGHPPNLMVVNELCNNLQAVRSCVVRLHFNDPATPNIVVVGFPNLPVSKSMQAADRIFLVSGR
eukprot:3933782-Rhodomonas_salina.1